MGQLTSIGYGGANVRGNDQKMFHAVNGLASQMGPNNIPGWLVRYFVDWVFGKSPIPKMIDEETDKTELSDEIRDNVKDRWGKRIDWKKLGPDLDNYVKKAIAY